MRKFFLTLTILFLTFGISNAQNISDLSLEECILLSLNNHPSLRKTKASIEDMAAQLESLRAATRVQVSLSGSAGYNGDFDYWDERYYSQSLSLSASQLLYDNSRNKIQRQIREESLSGSRETHRNTMISVAAEAKRKYYDLVLKFLDRDLQREKVNNLEEHLKNAQGLYDVGNSPYVDVTKAQADLSSAKVSLLKAENDILLAQEALKVAMGIETDSPFNILLPTELSLPSLPDETNNLVDKALQDRPDFRKAMNDIRAGELTIKNAARANSPTITGQLSASFSNRENSDASENYSTSLNMNVPLIDGGSTKASVASAKAQLAQTNADADSLKQSITYSVISAALSLKNANDSAKAAEQTVKYSEENLELSQGRYNVGVGNAIEVSDAVSALAEARHTYYQAIHDAQTARTDLDEALGHLPIEVEGSENLW